MQFSSFCVAHTFGAIYSNHNKYEYIHTYTVAVGMANAILQHYMKIIYGTE